MSKTLQVFVFDVGEGDHILIKFPNDEYGVIDFYYDPTVNPANEPPALTYLKSQENVKISFLHLSHYHCDHMKGLHLWLTWMRKNKIYPKWLWLPGAPYTFGDVDPWDEIIEDKAFQVEVARQYPELANKIIRYCSDNNKNPLWALKQFKKLESNMGFEVEYLEDLKNLTRLQVGKEAINGYGIAPPSAERSKLTEKTKIQLLEMILKDRHGNDFVQRAVSAMLLLRFGSKSLLFCNDARKKSIQDNIDYFKVNREMMEEISLESDLIKLPLNGSRWASSKSIWNALIGGNKKVKVVISAGEHASKNHPHITTIKQLRNGSSGLLDLYTTKTLENLGKSLKVTDFGNPTQTIELPWPTISPQEKAFVDRKKMLVNAHFNPRVIKYDRKSKKKDGFLGYRFDVSPNSQAIAVKKLVVKKGGRFEVKKRCPN